MQEGGVGDLEAGAQHLKWNIDVYLAPIQQSNHKGENFCQKLSDMKNRAGEFGREKFWAGNKIGRENFCRDTLRREKNRAGNKIGWENFGRGTFGRDNLGRINAGRESLGPDTLGRETCRLSHRGIRRPPLP